MKCKLLVCLAVLLSIAGAAQKDSTAQNADTIRIGGMVIIRDNNGDNKTVERESKNNRANIDIVFRKKNNDKPRSISTNWIILDLGFSNYTDNTNYADADAQTYAPGSNKSWFDLKNGKSRSVNFWFFMQRLNLSKNIFNLKYGLGLELNNYHYKQAIRYNATPAPVANPPRVILDNTAGRSYKKNKLAADYLTIPLMANFNFTPKKEKGFGFSVGVSAGFLYNARNKTITSDEGKEKAKDDFDLERWKLSYVAELALGPVRLYGSLATKSMYERGLNITPYNFGFRLSNW